MKSKAIADVKIAIIPVAGLGTRLLPATKVIPKEMLPVVDRPLIQYAIDEARSAGIERFVIVSARGKTTIEDHFNVIPEIEAALAEQAKYSFLESVRASTLPEGALVVVHQQKPRGLGHAILCTRPLLGEETPFVVLLPDDLILASKPCLVQMLEAYHELGGCWVAVEQVREEDAHRYGVVTPGEMIGRRMTIAGLVEKPDKPTSRWVVVGRYIFQPDIFSSLAEIGMGQGGEIQLTDAMAKLISHTRFHAYCFEGHRFDCGDRIGLLEAQIAVALSRDDWAPDRISHIQALIKDIRKH